MERPGPEENPCCREVQLRKPLLLLATLVVCVTYMAGNNPPGGVWWHTDGFRLLTTRYRRRYLIYLFCNSTALAASVVAIYLLLLQKPRRELQLIILRVVIVLGLLSLIGAYIAGSSREFGYTLYTGFLAIILLVYISYFFLLRVLLHCFTSRALQEERRQEEEEEDHENDVDDHAQLKPKERRKVLMLFASFVAAITYIAGLSFSGGYWYRVESTNQNGGNGLNYDAAVRVEVFIYFNSTAFMASLFVVVQLLTKKTGASGPLLLRLHGLLGTHLIRRLASAIRPAALYGSIHCLLGAYTVGTYLWRNVNALWLIAAYISLVTVMISTAWWCRQSNSEHGAATTDGGDEQEEPVGNTIRRDEACRKVKSLIVMLATLVAAITYQAGLHPPGGVWPDDRDGHGAGEPIILSTHPWRYKVFLYCNSGAFVSSLAAIRTLMVHKGKIHTVLLVSVILDMVALMGAYAAGTWMDVRSSICVIFVVVTIVMVVYVMRHLLCVTLRTTDMDYERLVKKRHTRLLLVANLVATITYQTGLNPPSGFRHQKANGYSAGAALRIENSLFWAIFCCNTVSFMAAMALILFFLVTPNQYRLGTRWYALYTCIVLALLGLMAAYAVGIAFTIQERTTAVAIIAIVVSVIGAHTIQSRSFLLKEEEEDDGSSVVGGPATIPRPRPRPRHIPRPRLTHRTAQETKYRQVYTSHKHLMLLGILAASATYQAGLNPPGGLWQENGDHGDAGSPVLYHRDKQRYQAFFYSNSTSLVASIFVVTLQLHQILSWGHQPKHRKLLVKATNTALVLDLLGLMVAYVAGTGKGW